VVVAVQYSLGSMQLKRRPTGAAGRRYASY
jgi:hypothetical protein